MIGLHNKKLMSCRRIFNVDASELPNLPLRKKNEKLHGEVRIVEVEDGDHTEMCTCCGTHFMSTAPVGLIKVLEHARYKSGCRITFAGTIIAWRGENAGGFYTRFADRSVNLVSRDGIEGRSLCRLLGSAVLGAFGGR